MQMINQKKRKKMIEKTFSVLGCGWFGFPLAKDLVKNGFTVNDH